MSDEPKNEDTSVPKPDTTAIEFTDAERYAILTLMRRTTLSGEEAFDFVQLYRKIQNGQ